jgi:hypothetical protein
MRFDGKVRLELCGLKRGALSEGHAVRRSFGRGERVRKRLLRRLLL